MLQICNACRYCEGFCAVFPAMTRRLRVRRGRRALPRQPVPQLRRLPARLPVRAAARVRGQRAAAMAQVRRETYADYAWPAAFGALYRRNGLTLSLALAAGAGAVPGAGRCAHGTAVARAAGRQLLRRLPAQPDGVAVRAGVPVRGARAWPSACGASGAGRERRARARPRPPREATRHVLALKYLDGGHGDGCNDEDDRVHAGAPALPPLHLLRLPAVLRGHLRRDALPLRLRLAGAVCLHQPAQAARHRRRRAADVGTAGLLALEPSAPPAAPRRRAATDGPRLHRAAVRSPPPPAWLLALARTRRRWRCCCRCTSACVMALFLTLPYGKFAHGIYRGAALLKWSIEKRQPAGPDPGVD